ncbi:MAG: hypothetical protein RLZZ15_1396 [Verrucomicrobiota bacterium]|jgi:hypothetical protein
MVRAGRGMGEARAAGDTRRDASATAHKSSVTVVTYWRGSVFLGQV